MSGYGLQHHAEEIRLRREDKRLDVTFEDGKSWSFTAEFLRVLSPSAEVQGHSPDQRQAVAGRKHVGIMKVEPVGNYAVKLVFDDLHDSGIYSWDYLYALGEGQERLWAEYEAELAAKGLTREPPKR